MNRNLKPKTMYYNTTSLTTEQLHAAVQKAKAQKQAVYMIMKKYGSMTAHECHTKYIAITGRSTYDGSIKRAMSDLKKDGVLTKTDVMRPGRWGDNMHVYKFNG